MISAKLSCSLKKSKPLLAYLLISLEKTVTRVGLIATISNRKILAFILQILSHTLFRKAMGSFEMSLTRQNLRLRTNKLRASSQMFLMKLAVKPYEPIHS